MSKTAAAVKKRVGRPPQDVPPPKPMAWESQAFAKRVQEILDALEVPPIDERAHGRLQRLLWLRDNFGGGDGEGHITLLVRTILESENNQDALTEPVISAVAWCMRPEWTNLGLKWIEAYDEIPLMSLLRTMQDLGLFTEKSLGHYLGMVLRNKLAPILDPLVSKPAPVGAKRGKPKEQSKRRPADQPARRMTA